MPSEDGPRRFLIATAVAHYKNAPDWDRPSLLDARQQIIDLFTGTFGYQHISDPGLDPTQHQLTERLREFCRWSELRADDMVAVYIAGHGEVLTEEQGGGHVLLTHDTSPDDVADALATELLARKMLLDTKVRRLLLMLDTCYSGQGGHELVSTALNRIQHPWSRTSGSALVLVSSSQPMEQAETGRFPRLLGQAVQDLATAGHAPAVLALDAVVKHMNRAPGHQRVGLTLAQLTGEVPPFLPNPRHHPQLREMDLAMQQDLLWQQEAGRRDVELRSRLLVRARGHDDRGTGWWFTGRRTALEDVTGWLSREPTAVGRPDVLVVTAGPGSGKTAILGLLAALAHPEIRRTVPVHSLDLPTETEAAARRIDVAIYAQTLTDQQVLTAIAAAARTQATTARELLAALENRPEPLTVLIDGLDEAATPDRLCDTVLHPLITYGNSRIRLLLGTRPHLLPRLGLNRDQHIDLDADRYADPTAVAAYAARNLVSAHPNSPYAGLRTLDTYAYAVAEAAGRSFLVARILAGTLAATPHLSNPRDPAWRASLPRKADQAMAADLTQRLRADAPRAIDLLTPLAYAEGQGLPWEDLWADIATATSGRPHTDEDLHWLRTHAGSYIVEAEEDGRSAYRLYHQAMADHLRTLCDDTDIHAAITRTLTDHVPLRTDGSRDWARAHPYSRYHASTHAAHGDCLDELLEDPEYLVHADPDGLAPHLHTAHSARARLSAAVYRSSIGTHRAATPEERRGILALDAARYKAPVLQAALNSRAQPGQWIPLHATGSSASRALRNTLTGHTDSITALACATLDGRPVTVTGSNDQTVRIWDLATGQPIGRPLIGHTGPVTAVACTTLDGRPVTVTGSNDQTVRIWDLATGQPIGQPLWDGAHSIDAVSCTALNGRPVAATVSKSGVGLRLWDLTTGQPIGRSLHLRAVAIACTTLDGQPVAVTRAGLPNPEDMAQIVDLPIDFAGDGYRTLGTVDQTDSVTAVTCTLLNDRPVTVIGSSDGIARMWDLTTCQPIGKPLIGHTGSVTAVACTTLDGRPVAVTGSTDSTIRIWDLTTEKPIDWPLADPTDKVQAVACTVLDGRPVAVTGSNNGLRKWDLTTGQPGEAVNPGDVAWVMSVGCTHLNDRPVAVAVTGSRFLQPRTRDIKRAVRIWDLTTGQPIDLPLTDHTGWINAVACSVLDSHPIAVTVTGPDDRAVRIWDLTTGQPMGQPLTGHTNAVWSVACTFIGGRPVAVTGSFDRTVRIWDLTTGQPMGQPLTGHSGPVTAVACMTLDGQPVALTGSIDRTLRIWDLSTRAENALIQLPDECSAISTLGATWIICAFDSDIATYGRSL